MGTMWPRSGSLEFASGVAAAGALAYFYEAGTTTPLSVYQDGAESTPHLDPVPADGNGRWPLVFVPYRATYKFILKTSAGTTLFTADNVPNPVPFDEAFEVDVDAQYQTGDFIFTGKNGSRSGAVRCNGKTVGSASSGATERANADTSDLYLYLWNNYADDSAAVTSGRGASAAADFAAHKPIALPDYRGAVLSGFGDMGSTDSGQYDFAPGQVGDPLLAGGIVGNNTHQLVTGELPAHTHSFSATTSGHSVDHFHNVTGTSAVASADHTHAGTTDSGGAHTHTVSGGVTAGTATFPTGNGGGAEDFPTNVAAVAVDSGGAHTHTFTTAGVSANHTHGININSAGTSSDHTHTVSGTSGSTGSNSAHNILQKSGVVTILMKL